MRSRALPGVVSGFILATLIVSPAPLQAALKPPGPAVLQLTLNSRGALSIYFILFTLPPKSEPLEAIIQQTVGMPLRSVTWDIDDYKEVVTFRAEAGPWPRHRLRLRGRIDPVPLDRFVSELGVSSLTITLIHPRAGFSRCSPGRLVSDPLSPLVQYDYLPPRGRNSPEPVEFEFGYDAHDFWLIIYILLGIACGLFAGGGRQARWLVPVSSSMGTPAQDQNSFSWQLPFNWLAWVATICVLEADRLGAFLFSLDSDLGEILLLIGMILLPLIFIDQAQRVVSRHLAHRVIGPSWGDLQDILLLAGFLALPTLLAAVAIVRLRHWHPAQALQWAASAAIVLGISSALAWGTKDRDEPENGETRPDRARELNLKRKSMIRQVAAQLAAILFFPAAITLLSRYWQLGDTARYLADFATLIASIVLLLLIKRFMTRGGLTERKSSGPFRTNRVPQILLRIGVVALLAWWICQLLDFPFNLTRGDEGWAFLFITLSAAFFQTWAEGQTDQGPP